MRNSKYIRILRAVSVLCTLFTLALLPAAELQAVDQLRFEKLKTADGLSSSSVSGICQDGTGFIWFATQAGLNRYDGVSFTIYENKPFDSNSLVHNQIQTIFSDDDGSLWIGTYGGLSHFDPVEENFQNFTHDQNDPESLSNNVVVSIARDSSGKLWVGTLDGLNRLDERTETFTVYRADEKNSRALPNGVVRAILSDSSGRLWIGTYGGLSRYNPETDTFTTRSGKGEDALDMGTTSYVMSINEDPGDGNILWLGVWGGGLCRFNTESGRSKLYPLPDNRVYTSYIDNLGRLWTGTWGGGLIRFSRNDGSITRYTSGMRDGIPDDIVYSLYQDSAGVLWIGTNGGGSRNWRIGGTNTDITGMKTASLARCRGEKSPR